MREAAFWFLVAYGIERFLETFWRRKKIEGHILAPYTLYLLVGAYVLIYLILFWEWSRWEADRSSSWIPLVGMMIVLASVIGRNLAIKTLGVYHSIHIEIRDNHELVQMGPYQYTRNPYYLSVIIEAVGLPLVAKAWLALFISTFVYIPLVILRLVLEERALEEKFRGSFVLYKRQIPRLFPRVT